MGRGARAREQAGDAVKIGDLFVSLGIESDKQSFNKARDDLGRFTKQADSNFAKLGARLGKIGTGFRKGINSKLGAAGIGAGLVLAAKDALEFDDSLTRLDISSRGAMGSMDRVREKVLAVSRATGVSKEELIAGSAAFVALTGDGKTATEAMETFAKVQKATGSPMEDIVGSAAALNEQLGITGTQFERAFSIMIAGGKAGKIELKDMASLTASLAAGYKQFGASKGIGGVATLGSAFQIVAKNFGSASEAATGLDALMGSIAQNAKELKKDQGIDIYEKDGKTLRSLEAITEDIGRKNLNATQVLALLKRKEAVKTFNALNDNRAQWESIREETLRANDVAVDYGKYQKSSAAQAAMGWNEVKLKIAEAFSPDRVQGLVKAISVAVGFAGVMVQKFEDAAGWFDHMAGADEDLGAATARKAAETKALREGATPADAAKAGNKAVRDMGGASINRGTDFVPFSERGFGKFNPLNIPGDLLHGSEFAIPDSVYRSANRASNVDLARRQGQTGVMEQDAATRAFDATAPMLPTSVTKGGRAVTISAPLTLTIQAPAGSDEKAIAGHVRRAFDEHRDAMVRDLDAATGGE